MTDLIGAPINGATDAEMADTTGPSVLQSTTGESLVDTAGSFWNSLPMQRMSRSNLRTMGQTAFDPDAPIQPGTGLEFDQGTATTSEDANAQAKQAGATLTPFSHPVGQNTLQDMIAENVAEQKRQDVIARSAAGIIASPARFLTGALVSLADPINDMAMMVPGLPEAWAARAIEAAGEGVIARTGVRAASGAVQGAAGMAALQPLAAVQASQDHEDYGWGDALRQVLFGAALGAGGGALHGILAGRPETTEAAMRAAMARVMTDDPRGADVGAILDRGEVSTAPPPANDVPSDAATHLTPELSTTGPDLAEKAAQSARDMATRAMNKTDPELEQTTRANASAIDTAPKLEGVVSKDTAEATQMLADKQAEYDSHVAAGRLAEHPSLADEGKAETEFGEAAKAYAATCGFGA